MIGTKIGPEKSSWEKYVKLVIVALIVIAGVYGGFQYFQHYQGQQAVKASLIYDQMLTFMRAQDPAKAKAEAETLKQQYAKTPYAPLAALLLAKIEIDDNQLDSAIQNLKEAMGKDEKGPVHQIARVRLARVMAARENYTEALSLLSPAKVPEGYTTLYEEAKGDIYLMQNEKDKAQEAYKAAQQAAPMGAPIVRLQLKLQTGS